MGINDLSFAKKVLLFNEYLSKVSISLPDGYGIKNPFSGCNKQINDITSRFYSIYYNDSKKRRLIVGSSPARRGSSLTGIPFEDGLHLKNTTGINIEDFYVNKSSANFLYEVIEMYGGSKKFYSDFYLNFVCPLGIVKQVNGREVNCNYYDSKKLQDKLYSFIIESIKKQIDLGIDTSIVYCIGSGDNYKFLSMINSEYHFFEKIVPLEHPRFIMQYNSKDKETYLKKYIEALTCCS